LPSNIRPTVFVPPCNFFNFLVSIISICPWPTTVDLSCFRDLLCRFLPPPAFLTQLFSQRFPEAASRQRLFPSPLLSRVLLPPPRPLGSIGVEACRVRSPLAFLRQFSDLSAPPIKIPQDHPHFPDAPPRYNECSPVSSSFPLLRVWVRRDFWILYRSLTASLWPVHLMSAFRLVFCLSEARLTPRVFAFFPVLPLPLPLFSPFGSSPPFTSCFCTPAI